MEKSKSNWLLRLASGFTGGLAFAFSLFLFPWVFRLGALAVILFSLLEFENLAFHYINKGNKPYHPSASSIFFLTSNNSLTISTAHRIVMLVIYLLSGLSYSIIAFFEFQESFLILSFVFVFIVSFLSLLVLNIICNFFERNQDISEESFVYFAFLFIGENWSGLLLSFAVILHFISPSLTFLTLLTVVSADSFAMIIGRPFGRHKLYIQLSPKKSIEGLLGGIFVGGLVPFVLLEYIVRPFIPLLYDNIYPKIFSSSPLLFAGVCFAIAFCGQLGDLSQSYIKRVVDLKDSNSDIKLVMFPGHGGILDRICGLIFACPFVMFLYCAFLKG